MPPHNNEAETAAAAAPAEDPQQQQLKQSAKQERSEPIKNAFNFHVNHAPLGYAELVSVFPPTTFPSIPELPFDDRAKYADPTLKNLLKDATVRHLAPKIGTEIAGVQLHELTDAQKDELALLAATRGVVIFLDQQITLDQQLALGKYYGPLHIHQNLGHPEGYPDVVVVEASVEKSPEMIHRQLYDPINHWHSDVTYERQPPSYTSFKLLTTPSEGGDTLWASSYEAYERLTPPMKTLLEGLTAIHSSKVQADDAAARGFTIRRPAAEFEHPVIRTHPVTKRKALFVNHAFTTRIKQLSLAESDAILRFLLAHIAQGHEFQVRYHWTTNAVAVWDNRITTHFGTFDYLPGNRQAQRVTPHGEIPFFDPGATPL